jgi:hypothetical protein
VDLNLAVAREVIGVVDEHFKNPVDFHVDDPSVLSMVALTDFRKGFPRMMEAFSRGSISMTMKSTKVKESWN